MASIQNRGGSYRVRYRDPSRRSRARSFTRKVDADRFAREVEVEVDMDRGDWFDRRKAEVLVGDCAEVWLRASLQLSPTSIQTCVKVHPQRVQKCARWRSSCRPRASPCRSPPACDS